MCADLLDKAYNPAEVEQRWYAFWEKEGLFAASEQSQARPFSIVIPPPNVTGVLHMGHALNNTMQDILCRFRRLKGDNVLWMPGTDHAGIATQNVVERKLAAEGKDRHQLGRESFIQQVWRWKSEYGSAIINQLKRLGASCDWQRERFTMDEGLSKAVRKVFVRLYNEGLIYRGNYIINWCPRCNTALSDLEVEHEELNGRLYHILYPFPGQKQGLVVATTRPETMLGDTAVAIHPEDERYRTLPSDTVVLPLMERKIPVIRDSYVDLLFGTGALKVTPAHDPNDFEIGKRHDLDMIKVIGDDGTMTEAAGRFAGLDRFQCRKKVVAELEHQGLMVRIEDHKHGVGHCYRCKSVVEPNLSRQWFVKAKVLAEPAIRAVEKGHTRIIPQVWTKTYFEWMRNIKDWCISRQIWWGHQIPAWTCQKCGQLIVKEETPGTCPECGSTNLVQESDVLDTWFSSALWPFSTMGWPEQTPLLKTFYPTSVLVTGFDILFFWVARMMMMGIHFMGETPFRDVYVHALVRDSHGKKMSKSKGNVIDPLDVIKRYGTDAFRFTLAAFAAQGRDIKLSEKRIEGYRHFVNKLWNASRLSLMHLDKDYQELEAQNLGLADRWILVQLARVTTRVEKAIDDYRFNEAAGAIYRFVWHQFCDWYLEAAKPALYDEHKGPAQLAAKQTLWRVMHETLILLHPFVPFVTEEIWHKLPGTQGSIMKAPWPVPEKWMPANWQAAAIVDDMQQVMDVITAVRNIRGEMNIAPGTLLTARIQASGGIAELLEEQKNLICDLARIKSFDIGRTLQRSPTEALAIAGQASIMVELSGIVDFDKEVARLNKNIAKLGKELAGLEKKLSNSGFLAKAPRHVIAEVRQRHGAAAERKAKLEATVAKIKDLV